MIAQPVLDTLDEALNEYVEDFHFKEPNQEIEVILYPATNFKSFVADSPDWAEGLFDGRIRVPIREEWLNQQSFNSLRTVLRHELVHALFARMSDFRNLPTWFNEGMAQRVACHRQCSGTVFGQKPANFLDSEDFHGAFTNYNPIKARVAYQQSIFLIYTIERKFGGFEALQKIIAHINRSNRLDSDSLLKTNSIDFNTLRKTAANLWNDRIALGPQTL